ncbi:hypothetical protein AB0M43_37825 [Longispora sp. NPDC051575]|uniref:hypothetical protein n=1 Tax=Longispora sp. NPDC051575 TaxID=3154943 RepID=UPI003440A680
MLFVITPGQPRRTWVGYAVFGVFYCRTCAPFPPTTNCQAICAEDAAVLWPNASDNLTGRCCDMCRRPLLTVVELLLIRPLQDWITLANRVTPPHRCRTLHCENLPDDWDGYCSDCSDWREQMYDLIRSQM